MDTKVKTILAFTLVPILSAGLLLTAANADNTPDEEKTAPCKYGKTNSFHPGPAFHPGLKGQFTPEITKLDNGIEMIITIEDPKVLKKMQSHEPKTPRLNSEIKITKENLENGIKITKTSDNQEVVAHLHEMADRIEMKKSITRETTNIDNGIVMTIISTDPEVVKKIQSKEEKEPKNPEIQKVKENIENGVKITIASGNQELVEKIQNRSEKKPFGKRGKRKHFGNKKGMNIPFTSVR